MSHYAKVDNGIVVSVINAEADFFTHFVDTSPGKWIQTSYNTKGGIHYSPTTGQPDGGTALRANFAGIGYIYDEINDVFHAPRPLDRNNILCGSWTISAPNWIWTPPTPMPDTTNFYVWDEPTKAWIELS